MRQNLRSYNVYSVIRGKITAVLTQEETRDEINYYYRLCYIVPRGLSWGEGATMLLYKSAVSHSSCLKEHRLPIGKMEKHWDEMRWDEGTGRWSSVPRDTEDVLGSIVGPSGLMMTWDIETWRAMPLKMRPYNMDITWEDTGSQCVDSRPNGQKTEQKKVTLFATYSMLIIRNRRKKVCTKCEILLIIAYLEKKLQLLNWKF